MVSMLDPHSTPQDLQRFDRLWIPVTESGCWLWLGGCDNDGDGKAKVNRKHIRAHRWSWMLHRGEIPAGLHVLHHCDVTCCVNPGHLFLGTNLENDQDKRQKGREYVLEVMKGEAHPHAVLTEAEVLEIRSLRGKVRQVDLAVRYGVHHSHISRVQRGKFWAYLER